VNEPTSPRNKDFQLFPELRDGRDPAGDQDLFFDARPSTARQSHAIARTIGQAADKFIATATDGFGMQARDFRDPFDPPMTTPHGFASRDPTTLLLVQTAQQLIQSDMISPLRMLSNLTRRTATLSNARIHGHFPSLHAW